MKKIIIFIVVLLIIILSVIGVKYCSYKVEYDAIHNRPCCIIIYFL